MILINQAIVKQKYKKSIAKKPKLEPELKPKLEPELKPKFEESLTERTMFREQRLNEIAKKEKTIDNNLFKEQFEYSSPSNMYRNLNTTKDIEENKTKVNKIKNNSADLMMEFKNKPTNNAKKLETEITC